MRRRECGRVRRRSTRFVVQCIVFFIDIRFFPFVPQYQGPDFCCPADVDNVCEHTKKRRKQERSPASRDRLTISAEILAMTCGCNPQCAYNLRSKIPDIVQRVKEARTTLHQNGRIRSSATLFNKLLAMRTAPHCSGGKHVVNFAIGGVSICGHVWCALHGVNLNDSRMKKILSSLRRGDNEWVDKTTRTVFGISRSQKQGWRGAWLRAWMRKHVKKFADFNPATLTASLDPDVLEVRHLLYSIAWGQRAAGSRSGPPIKFSRFAELWSDFVKAGYTDEGVTYKIEIRKPRSGFTCNICQIFRDRIRRASGVNLKEEIRSLLKQHLQQVRQHDNTHALAQHV